MCGLGVSLRVDEGGDYRVGRLEPGGAAARSGLVRAGDVLVEVDGAPVRGMPYAGCALTAPVRALNSLTDTHRYTLYGPVSLCRSICARV